MKIRGNEKSEDRPLTPEEIEKLREDPAAFAEIVAPEMKMYPLQEKLMKEILSGNRFSVVLVGQGRRYGKTLLTEKLKETIKDRAR